jgi:hypothetical protein
MSDSEKLRTLELQVRLLHTIVGGLTKRLRGLERSQLFEERLIACEDRIRTLEGWVLKNKDWLYRLALRMDKFANEKTVADPNTKWTFEYVDPDSPLTSRTS